MFSQNMSVNTPSELMIGRSNSAFQRKTVQYFEQYITKKAQMFHIKVYKLCNRHWDL